MEEIKNEGMNNEVEVTYLPAESEGDYYYESSDNKGIIGFLIGVGTAAVAVGSSKLIKKFKERRELKKEYKEFVANRKAAEEEDIIIEDDGSPVVEEADVKEEPKKKTNKTSK